MLKNILNPKCRIFSCPFQQSLFFFLIVSVTIRYNPPPTLLAMAAMSAFARSKADRVTGLASILSTAAVGGLRMRMSRLNILPPRGNHETKKGRQTRKHMVLWYYPMHRKRNPQVFQAIPLAQEVIVMGFLLHCAILWTGCFGCGGADEKLY